MNQLFLISKKQFEKIQSNTEFVKCIYGYYESNKFFNRYLVNSELPKDKLLDLDRMRFEEIAVSNIINKDTTINLDQIMCFYDVITNAISIHRVISPCVLEYYRHMTLNDLCISLAELCIDIDNNEVFVNQNGFLFDPLRNQSHSLKMAKNAIWDIIISETYKINRNRLAEIRQRMSSLYIRMYPIESSPFGWVSGCFEFTYNNNPYRIQI